MKSRPSYSDMKRLGGTETNYTLARTWWEYAFHASNEGATLDAIAKGLKVEGDDVTVQLSPGQLERLIEACERQKRVETAKELRKALGSK